MPSAFDERERLAIKARLLEAAMHALSHGGLGAASVSRLAESASIAKGSFYAFYQSKEELFMDALESIEAGYRARFEKAASGAGTPIERLERAFRAAFDLIDTEPALGAIDATIMERLARALPPERIERHAAGDAEAIARLAEAWRAEGLLASEIGDEEVAGAGYAIFLVAMGLKNLPDAVRAATKRVVIGGLARSLAASTVPMADHPEKSDVETTRKDVPHDPR